jgi:hypothetical protein
MTDAHARAIEAARDEAVRILLFTDIDTVGDLRAAAEAIAAAVVGVVIPILEESLDFCCPPADKIEAEVRERMVAAWRSEGHDVMFNRAGDDLTPAQRVGKWLIDGGGPDGR